jgi:ankyrin repeat protein
VVTHLLNAGANINSEEPADCKTPLILACEKGYIELVKFILDQDEVDIEHNDQKQRTAIMYAVGSAAQN